jgi:hypothetical protein
MYDTALLRLISISDSPCILRLTVCQLLRVFTQSKDTRHFVFWQFGSPSLESRVTFHLTLDFGTLIGAAVNC